jgi:dynein heavy chain
MSVKDNCNNKESFIKLWIHETMRIFGDRLVEQEEKDFLNNLVNKNLTINFGSDLKIEEINMASEDEPHRVLLFADYFRESKLYEECNDLRKAQKNIEVFMGETNNNLVLFR